MLLINANCKLMRFHDTGQFDWFNLASAAASEGFGFYHRRTEAQPAAAAGTIMRVLWASRHQYEGPVVSFSVCAAFKDVWSQRKYEDSLQVDE